MTPFDELLKSWEAFYLAVATAAATLVGLLFVAVSVNIQLLRGPEGPHHRDIAGRTFGDFLFTLMLSLVLLIPHQEPVGLAVARNPDAGEGVELPPGAVEIELWILARHRGQGTRWFALVTEWMAERFEVLVSVLWEGSGQVAALLSRSGWERLGSSFWSGPGGAGNCDVFCYYALGRHVSTQLG